MEASEVPFAHEGPDAPLLLIKSTSSSTLVSSSLSKCLSALCLKSRFVIRVYVFSGVSLLPAWLSIPSQSRSPSSVPTCFCLSLVYIKPFVWFSGGVSRVSHSTSFSVYLRTPFKKTQKAGASDVDVVYLDRPQPSAHGPHLPKPSSCVENIYLHSISQWRLLQISTCLSQLFDSPASLSQHY